MNLGEKLRELRLQKNLTQLDVANDLNISQQTYSRYEIGRYPDIETLKMLAEYFNVSADYLLDISKNTIDKNELNKFIQKIENELTELKNFIK